MNTFKVENFKRENPKMDFPWYETLDITSLDTLKEKVSSALSLSKEFNFDELIALLRSFETFERDINASDADFNMLKLLESKNIKPNDTIYVNWYRFDEVDRMKVKELSKYFSDIWYPSSDDIEIFDDSYSWFTSISHSGEVTVTQIHK